MEALRQSVGASRRRKPPSIARPRTAPGGGPRLPGRKRLHRRQRRKCLPLFDDLELLKPANEPMGCPVGLLHGPRALDRVQDLVALVDSGTRLLLAGKAGGVFEIADDPAISEVQFRCEEELRHHASRNDQLSQRFRRDF